MLVSRRAFSAFACAELAAIASGVAHAGQEPGELGSAFPALAATLPRKALASLPTRVDRAEALGAVLGLDALYLKRDDLSGALYGGGKPRKLEYFFGDALALRKRRIVTVGGASSNHLLATAIYAKAVGLGATLLVLPEPASAEAGRRLLAAAHFGAELRAVATQQAAERELVRLAPPGSDAYSIPSRGSSALGNVAFVAAGLELARQVKAGLLPEPASAYVALGSMGSAVGLLIGLQIAGLNTHLVAVRASSPGTSSAQRFRDLYRRSVDFLRARDSAFPALSFPASQVTLEGGFLGRGYGIPTPAGERAMRVAAETESLRLERTYTAKALSALMAAAPNRSPSRTSALDPARPVLFWLSHTEREPEVVGTVDALPRALRGYVRERG